MIGGFLRVVWMIRNKDKIAPLPRGMLASKYDDIPREYRQVLARLGARDIRGVKLAMRRYGVDNLDALVDALNFYHPPRRIWHRLINAFGKVRGGYDYDPHESDYTRDRIQSQKLKAMETIRKRMKIIEDSILDV